MITEPSLPPPPPGRTLKTTFFNHDVETKESIQATKDWRMYMRGYAREEIDFNGDYNDK